MSAAKRLPFVTYVLFSFIVFTGSLSFAASKFSAKPPKALVVLLPGLGNAAFDTVFYERKFGNTSSGYFSHHISRAIMDLNYDVLAIRGLGLPKIHQNGKKALKIINEYYQKYYADNAIPIYLLGHSLGGLFATSVAHLNQGELPIKKIITLSTPWMGSRLIELFTHNVISELMLRGLAGTLAPIFDIRAAFELIPERVEAYLSGLEIPTQTKIYAFAGYQKPNRFIFPSLSPNVQPPAYLPLAVLLKGKSDGAVLLPSSLPENLFIQSAEKGTFLQVKSIDSELAFLDHGEQHLSPEAVQTAFLTLNVHLIADRQYEFYQYLMNHVEN